MSHEEQNINCIENFVKKLNKFSCNLVSFSKIWNFYCTFTYIKFVISFIILHKFNVHVGH